MGKEIAKVLGIVGIVGLGCGNIEISYRGNNVPESCKAIAEDAKAFKDWNPVRKGLGLGDPGYMTSKCAKRAYMYDNTCTIPASFHTLANKQGQAASQYCLWLDMEAEQ